MVASKSVFSARAQVLGLVPFWYNFVSPVRQPNQLALLVL
jgi:hypothetical protein